MASLALLAAVAWAGLVLVPIPRILALRSSPPRTTAFIEARRSRLLAEGKPATIDRRPVPLSRVSPDLVRAVLAAEDARFFEHHGVDWAAIQAARQRNRRFPRKPPLGASTLTQQLAKNLWLSPDRSLLRKGREAAIAVTMELLLDKRQILEHYLSAIEFGERVYGCEAAARTYFGVPASALTPRQAAWLAALIPAPRTLAAHPARLERRAERISRRMAASRPRPGGAGLDDDEDDAPR